MDAFTGYDLFTGKIHYGTPRLPATDAPDVCIICHDTGDEHLFVNPRTVCRCSMATHASCWGKMANMRCPLCRVAYPRPVCARREYTSAIARVPVPQGRAIEILNTLLVYAVAYLVIFASAIIFAHMTMFTYCQAAAFNDILPFQHAAQKIRATSLYKWYTAPEWHTLARVCAETITDARRICENDPDGACVCDTIRCVRSLCCAYADEC